MTASEPRTNPHPILVAKGVTKRVVDGAETSVILREVSLEVMPGTWVALMGPSGSGKSTLLQILGALDPHYEGEVVLDGRALGQLSDGERARLRNEALGFVFQAYNLLGHLSLIENVVLPARFSGASPDRERAQALLTRVNMGTMATRRPRTLSGGERQRVAIARALYHRPRLILCDEPTGNLDAATGAEILELFASLREEGVALVMATHDREIAAVADRVVTLRAGVVEQSAPSRRHELEEAP